MVGPWGEAKRGKARRKRRVSCILLPRREREREREKERANGITELEQRGENGEIDVGRNGVATTLLDFDDSDHGFFVLSGCNQNAMKM